MHALLLTLLTFFSLLASCMGAALNLRAVSSSSLLPSSSPTSSTPSPTTTFTEKPTFRAKSRVFSPDANATVRAYFDITGYADGRGTYVKVEVMAGLAAANGPYAYHVHMAPVPADGNCTSTLGHLDPLVVSDAVECDPNSPQSCEEGDLSGKHGKMNGTDDGSVNAFGYTDEYLRFFPQQLSLLGRSIVIHDKNKTRIACGNITSTLDGTMDASNEPTRKASTYVTAQYLATKTNATLPVSVARPALSIKQALFVNLTMVPSTVTVNGTQTAVEVPTLVQINGTIPFNMTAALERGRSWV